MTPLGQVQQPARLPKPLPLAKLTPAAHKWFVLKSVQLDRPMRDNIICNICYQRFVCTVTPNRVNDSL